MRFTVEKLQMGESYPRNGNVHNPTPKVLWVVKDETGRIVDRARTKRLATEYANQYEKNPELLG